jgi:hypothetical protein
MEASEVSEKWYTDPIRFWPLYLEAGKSCEELSRRTGVPARTLRRYVPESEPGAGGAMDYPLGPPRTTITNDLAEITTRPLTRWNGESVTPEEVLEEHGLDAEHWDVVTYTSNRWEGPSGGGGKLLFEQSKLTAKRKAESIVGIIKKPPGWSPPAPIPVAATRARPTLKVLLADPHAPLQEQDFEEGIIAWCQQHQPDEIYCLGDSADNSPWSRHKQNRRIKVSANEAMQAQYDYFVRLRAACPNARIVVIWGNHDFWIIDRIMEDMPHLGRARSPHTGRPLIDLPGWLGFDDLNIEEVQATGEYHDGVTQIMPDLVGLHGTKSGPYGGAVKEFDTWESASVVQGHDHKGAIVLISKRLPDGTHVQRVAMSAGSGAGRDLGYDPRHNVGQSFLTITAHQDGQWHPEMAIFNPQTRTTTWRDWRYTPPSAA